jgi:outer membrane protein assembly factor BamB
LKRNFLSLGIIFLFIISAISPIVISNTIKPSNEIVSESISSSGLMNSSWPMLSHDIHHTGQSELSTSSNPGAEIWRVRSSYHSEMCQSNPVIDNNGTIYIGLKGYDDNSYLIAYYPNGTEIWRFLSDSWIWCTPAIGEDGTIYFTTCGDYFYAVNPNGTLKWRYDHDYFSIYSSPAIAPDGTIYICTSAKVYALRQDGTKKWEHMLGGSIRPSPVIGPDGTIYIGCGDYYLYALDPDDGEMIWHYQTGYGIDASPSLASDGTIYVPSRDGYLYALYSNNGTFKWKATTGPKVVGYGCAIANDGTIYVGTEKLRAYNPNGTLKWESDVKGWVYGSVPAISSDGTIFVNGGGCLVAVNPDGTIKWYKQLSSVQIEASPCIGPDDRVYTASRISGANYLSAFGIGPVRADAQGPYLGYATYPLQFQGLDLGGIPPYIYLWDFGDGNTSTVINPVHNYSQVGNYTASFTITDSEGNSSTNTTYVTVLFNQAPDTPIIDGTNKGTAGKKYPYTFTTSDPEGQKVWYYIDWGDGSNPVWKGPYNSGITIKFNHTWADEGTYTIRCKAKDLYDDESSYGELTVKMPRDKAISNSLFLRFLERYPMLNRLLNILV